MHSTHEGEEPVPATHSQKREITGCSCQLLYVRGFERPIVFMNEGTVSPRMIALVTTLTHLMETSSGKDASKHPLLLPLPGRNSCLSIGQKKRIEVCEGKHNKVAVGAQECREMLKQRRNIWAKICLLLNSATKCLIGSYRARI